MFNLYNIYGKLLNLAKILNYLPIYFYSLFLYLISFYFF